MSIEIVGICLVKNEDIYVERVLRNIVNFCDKIRVIDNNSQDKTVEVVKKCMSEFSNISLEHIENVNETHRVVQEYAGEDKWIFGVDGDEIYDPLGLAILRPKILSGGYQKCWMLRGYFYHLVKLDLKNKKARGYLAPPAKDPNKLYNFSLLESWKSDFEQPLFHCQTHVFKNRKYHPNRKPKKKKLYLQYEWRDCPIKCVHTRMLQRSTSEKYKTAINARLNLSNVISNKKYNFRKKYRIGKKVEMSVSEFFR